MASRWNSRGMACFHCIGRHTSIGRQSQRLSARPPSLGIEACSKEIRVQLRIWTLLSVRNLAASSASRRMGEASRALRDSNPRADAPQRRPGRRTPPLCP